MKFRFESDISEFWSIHSFLPWNAVINYIESPLCCLILSIPLCEYIHVAGSHLVFTGSQKQIQFMSMFSCLLMLLFSSNMLHLQQRNSIISCLIYSSYYHCFCEDKTQIIWGTQKLFCYLTCATCILSSPMLGLKHILEFLFHSPINFLPSVSYSSSSSFM